MYAWLILWNIYFNSGSFAFSEVYIRIEDPRCYRFSEYKYWSSDFNIIPIRNWEANGKNWQPLPNLNTGTTLTLI